MPTTPEDDDLALADNRLRTNAWCGDAAAEGGIAASASAWAMRGAIPRPRMQLGPAAARIDKSKWQDPKVGWGLVLPDREGFGDADKANAADAPAAIRRLVAARGDAPVFRYRADVPDGRLRRYYANGKPPADLRLRGTRGVESDAAVPWYLLIVGSPREIPWSFQYRLQTDAFVGRLDLDEPGLERYVDALLGDWAGSARDSARPLLWSVDHGARDITRLMRKAVAERMRAAFQDGGFDATLLSDDDASAAALYAALAERSPAFVLTTSHGATFPLDDSAGLAGQLGLPVDCNHALLDAVPLLAQWRPSGAIWYAHACCSAGAGKPSEFAGLVEQDSGLGRMLAAVADAGPCSAPLPRALLGGEHPLGAFIGHVEPTFDWTLRDPDTGQRMTDSLVIDTLYSTLHAVERPPVGMAMDGYYDAVAGPLLDHLDAVEDFNAHVAGAGQRARKAKLLAMDRLAMVVLGDPTVRLPG